MLRILQCVLFWFSTEKFMILTIKYKLSYLCTKLFGRSSAFPASITVSLACRILLMRISFILIPNEVSQTDSQNAISTYKLDNIGDRVIRWNFYFLVSIQITNQPFPFFLFSRKSLRYVIRRLCLTSPIKCFW